MTFVALLLSWLAGMLASLPPASTSRLEFLQSQTECCYIRSDILVEFKEHEQVELYPLKRTH